MVRTALSMPNYYETIEKVEQMAILRITVNYANNYRTFESVLRVETNSDVGRAALNLGLSIYTVIDRNAICQM